MKMKKINVLILALILMGGGMGLSLIAQTTTLTEPTEQEQQKRQQQEEHIKAVNEEQLDNEKVPRNLEERQTLARKLYPYDGAAQKSFEAETDRYVLRNMMREGKYKIYLEDRPRLLAESSSAQALENERGRRDNQDDREKVIRDAGNKGDKSLIPYLRYMVEQENSKEAAIALVNLGETEYLDQMLAESQSDKLRTKADAIYKLAYVGQKGNKQAMQRLYELLDPDEKPTSDGDDVRLPLSYSVTYLLAKLIPHPPTKGEGKEAILLWRKWFEKNGLN